MKCPTLLANLSLADRSCVGAGECIREECAEWEPDMLMCSRRVWLRLAVEQKTIDNFLFYRHKPKKDNS